MVWHNITNWCQSMIIRGDENYVSVSEAFQILSGSRYSSTSHNRVASSTIDADKCIEHSADKDARPW